VGVEVFRLRADDDRGVDPARAAAHLAEHCVTKALIGGATHHEGLPEPACDPGERRLVAVHPFTLAAFRSRRRDRGQIRRLAHHRDLAERRSARAVRPDDGLDVPLEVVRERPERNHSDSIPLEHPSGQRREHLLLEVGVAVELSLEVVGPPSCRGQVALQALLEVLRRPRDDVVPEADPDQDADGQRDEDGGQRGGVIAP
jgi:hypothetical protein